MEEQCRNCEHICKKLENDESPAYYQFNYLAPTDVLRISEQVILNYDGMLLSTEDSAVSFGNQLAVMMQTANTIQDDSSESVLFILQAAVDDNARTRMWIRYGTPPILCGETAIMSEFTGLIKLILQELERADREKQQKYHL